MPAARALRPNIFVLLIIAGGLLLLGIDRFANLPLLRPIAIVIYALVAQVAYGF